MIKIVFLTLLFFSFSFGDFKLVSWNLKNVSLNSLLFKKSIGKINQYIKTQNDADVILLQELRDRQIIYFLSGGIKEIVFSPFERFTSNYKGTGTHKEVFGFLVNRKYKDIKLLEFGNYSQFKRPPTAVILDKKIAVVNVHIVYGKYVKDRKDEVKALNSITKFLKSVHNIKESNIYIAGDFNLSYKNMMKIHKDKQIWVTEKTTVGRTKFSKDYDHFITIGKNGSAKPIYEIVDDFKFYRKNISDHVPIEGVFH